MGDKIESRRRLLQFPIFLYVCICLSVVIVFDILETKRLRVSV